MQNSSFRNLLLNLPVSINGLADPAILRDSSERKLDALVADGHRGPVAIVTKGNLSTPWWKERLARWASALDLIVFASISGLSKEIEPVSLEGRYKTLRAARDAGAKVISYIRPIVPGVNDSRELLHDLVARSADSGCHAVVSSGFRGTDSIVSSSGFEAVPQASGTANWQSSVKLMQPASEAYLRELCAQYGVKFWTGTHCAVAGLTGKTHSLAPYHMAPQFAGCETCELRSSCLGAANKQMPVEGSLELLRYFGYQADFYAPSAGMRACDVEVRSTCSQHCSNCTVAPERFGVPYVALKRGDGSVPSWGDLCLARFLTGGVLCTNPDLAQEEVSAVKLHPRFVLPDGNNGVGPLYITTSWVMWSEYLPKEQCFNCSYCYLAMYAAHLPKAMQGTVSLSPVRLLDYESTEHKLSEPALPPKPAFSLPVISSGCGSACGSGCSSGCGSKA